MRVCECFLCKFTRATSSATSKVDKLLCVVSIFKLKHSFSLLELREQTLAKPGSSALEISLLRATSVQHSGDFCTNPCWIVSPISYEAFCIVHVTVALDFFWCGEDLEKARVCRLERFGRRWRETTVSFCMAGCLKE